MDAGTPEPIAELYRYRSPGETKVTEFANHSNLSAIS